MVTLYGIPNCDSVKKAMAWLKKRNIVFEFYDFRQNELSNKKIEFWLKKLPLEKLLNKQSTAWRLLSDSDKTQAVSEKSAAALMCRHNNLIKRPVLETDNALLAGFNESAYELEFSKL